MLFSWFHEFVDKDSNAYYWEIQLNIDWGLSDENLSDIWWNSLLFIDLFVSVISLQMIIEFELSFLMIDRKERSFETEWSDSWLSTEPKRWPKTRATAHKSSDSFCVELSFWNEVYAKLRYH